MQRVVKYGIFPNGACFIQFVSLLIKGGLIYDNEGDINSEPPTYHRRKVRPIPDTAESAALHFPWGEGGGGKKADSNRESLPISPIIYRKIKAVECKSM